MCNLLYLCLWCSVEYKYVVEYTVPYIRVEKA